MTVLPEAFIQRMSLQLGNELQDFIRAMDMPPVRGIRMNALKPFKGMEAYTRGQPVPWEPDGYLISSENHAGSTIFHEAGAFYLQDPAAMLPVEIMNVKPGERILDLCAAPGGKSTQIGSKMHGEGLLICNEPVPKRAMILSRNLERMGIKNSVVISCFPEKIPSSWNRLFDGVLVDAPCSGEGMFRKDPETRNEWSPEQTAGCARRQHEILHEASRMVRPGGRLVYSTCTFNPEENERVICRFIHEHPDFTTESFSLPGAESKEGMLLCLPHRMKGEGQFVAKLRRSGDCPETLLSIPMNKPAARLIAAVKDQLPGLPEPNAVFGNMLVSLPLCPPLEKMRVLRAGLHLAEMRGMHLIPDHASALCSHRFPYSETELNSEQAEAYIKGSEISGDAVGWTIIKYRGLRLGWGKGSNGSIKNHYPKALRKERIFTET